MPLVEVKEIRVTTPRFKRKGQLRRIGVWKCDFCDKLFERPYVQDQEKHLHFCSNECHKNAKKRGGIVNQKTIATNNQKYGVDFASMLDEVKKKQRETNLRVYGSTATSQNQLVEDKRRATCEKKYGGPAATSSSKVAAKVRSTLLVRMNDVDVREKFSTTMQRRYGKTIPAQVPEILHKQHETNLDRYGVKYPFHSDDAKRVCRSLETQRKRHETRKLNGTYASQRSTQETKFIDWLKLTWTIDEHVFLHSWSIDAYVRDIDTYVQFDGVYWHGLDRSFTLISEQRSKIDTTIIGTIARDLKQNAWFLVNGKRLLRIKDVDFNKIDTTINPTLKFLKSLAYVVI